VDASWSFDCELNPELIWTTPNDPELREVEYRKLHGNGNVAGAYMESSFPRVAFLAERDKAHAAVSETSQVLDSQGVQAETILSESMFHSLLALERRRAARSNKYFILMLLDANLESGPAGGILKQAAEVVIDTKRETDLAGWYEEDVILGVIVTEVSLQESDLIMETLRIKIESNFIEHLGQQKAAKVAISLHLCSGRLNQVPFQAGAGKAS
jgi:hypothetical protein